MVKNAYYTQPSIVHCFNVTIFPISLPVHSIRNNPKQIMRQCKITGQFLDQLVQ